MKTGQKIVQRQFRAEPLMDRLHSFDGLGSAGDVRLVGDHQQNQPQRLQLPERGRGVPGKAHGVGRGRRVGLAVAYDGLVQNTVPVEEDRSVQRTVSHLVSACFTLGCDTRRCQTTA